MAKDHAERSLRSEVEQLGVALNSDQLTRLSRYLYLLQQWNRAYNLTAITDLQDMVSHHLLDSLSIVPYLKGERFIDVGTGAGLPGIPLAIACPDRHLTLLDSNGKRVRFLFQVKTDLALANIHEVHARVESYVPQGGYDGIISRAFSSLLLMVSATKHLLAPGGRFYAMKGRYPEKELSELPKPFNVSACHRLVVPGVEGERHLVEISQTTTG